jgi:hypothetical protein
MILSKFFKFVKKNNEDIVLFVGVALISLLSFTVGYIVSEASRDEPIQFETQIETKVKADGTNIGDIEIGHMQTSGEIPKELEYINPEK